MFKKSHGLIHEQLLLNGIAKRSGWWYITFDL